MTSYWWNWIYWRGAPVCKRRCRDKVQYDAWFYVDDFGESSVLLLYYVVSLLIFLLLSFLFPISLGIGHDIKQGEGSPVSCPQIWCPFSTSHSFTKHSNRKFRIGSWGLCLKSSLFCDEVEQMRCAPGATGVEDEVLGQEWPSWIAHDNGVGSNASDLPCSMRWECTEILLMWNCDDGSCLVDELWCLFQRTESKFGTFQKMLKARNDCSKLAWKQRGGYLMMVGSQESLAM